MKKTLLVMVFGLVLAIAGFAQAAVTTNIIQYPLPEFVDPADPLGNYRWWDEDWGWQHDAIGGSITSATLNISAWDVDWNSTYSGGPERDIIYAMDSGSWVNLGYLTGEDSTWSYTTFNLGSNFYDDIALGLNVWIDIDSTHNYDTWAVALAKSALSIDGGAIPTPEPGTTVPEPGMLLLFGSGLAGLAFFKRRK